VRDPVLAVDRDRDAFVGQKQGRQVMLSSLRSFALCDLESGLIKT
jgi:hypothetical protein